MKKHGRLSVAACCVIALALLSGSAAPAGALQPIEGSWFFEGGQVLVEPIGPNVFKGTVIQQTSFSECTHPVGQRMWEISGSAANYAGTHVYFNNGVECSPAPGGMALWAVGEDPTRFRLDFCSAPPGMGVPGPSTPTTHCVTLDRAKAPPDRTQACASGGRVCLDGPEDLRTIGCLRRVPIRHRFRINLKPGGGRRATVTVVSFQLDGRPAGRDRRAPFETVLTGETLAPSAHLLKATVTLRRPGSGRRGSKTRSRARTVVYKFNACEQG